MPRYPNVYDENEIVRIEAETDVPPAAEPEAGQDASPPSEPNAGSPGFGPDRKQVARSIKFYSYATLAFFILFVVLINCFVKVQVVGESMLPTYKHGDIIWASRWKGVKCGSVVFFDNPLDPKDKPLIKRVAGFDGDIFYFDGDDLYREIAPANAKRGGTSGVVQTNVTKKADILAEGVFDENGRYTVPAGGYIFVLGDNYSNSKDSRYFGAVPNKSVRGVIYGG